MYIVVILDFKMPHQSYHRCLANVCILSHYHIIYPLGMHHDHHIVNIIVTSLYISSSLIIAHSSVSSYAHLFICLAIIVTFHLVQFNCYLASQSKCSNL